MIGAYSPQLEIAGKRNYTASQLKDIPSNELEEYVKWYGREHGQEIFDASDLLKMPSDSDFFIACSATEILRERHGKDYVAKITRKRGPKTFKEWLICLATDKLFDTNKERKG